MNKEQRKRLAGAIEILREIAEEEHRKVDEAPESLAESEQYERMDETADALDDAASDLDEYAS